MNDLGSIFDAGNLPLLKQALSAYALRHRVTADNIANVATEGYRAQRVQFEELLERQDPGAGLAGLRTDPGHLPIGGPPAVQEPRTVEEAEGFDNGVNDVDIDKEMIALGQNQLMYQMATRLLHRKYQGLRMAITGQTR